VTKAQAPESTQVPCSTSDVLTDNVCLWEALSFCSTIDFFASIESNPKEHSFHFQNPFRNHLALFLKVMETTKMPHY
jgi:hypothetical protein